MSPSAKLLSDLNITSPLFICETALASIFKVIRFDGNFAALKMYKNGDMKDEVDGYRFLQALNGDAAVKIFQVKDNGIVLMEWLEGPSLGDMARQGQDFQSLDLLIDVANKIHKVPNIDPAYENLAEMFNPLFSLTVAQSASPVVQQSMKDSKALAKHLIDTQKDMRVLHRDLHHDNVIQSERGCCAIDAKGVFGERGYELANAVLNPVGMLETVQKPERILKYIDTISARFNVDYARFFSWVIAHCALSIAWRCEGTLDDDPYVPMLETVWRLAKEQNLKLL